MGNEKLKIYVDPSSNVYYASYYLEGIRRLYGKRAILYRSADFGIFKYNGLYLPVVLRHRQKQVKLIIDFGDICDVNREAYDWCDHYAKINIAFGDLEKHDKLFSIGPTFGINVFSKIETVWYGLTNFLKARKRIRNPKQFLSDYRAQYKRYKVERYKNRHQSENDWIFFASSLWKTEPVTNQFRANFIKACKNVSAIRFEGGFSPRTRNDIPGFDDLTMTSREDFDSYVEKTKKSLAVFNTPAVGLCHGWKLGEYLAMGKAIITTPITRELPEDFENGRHVLITDGSQEDIRRAIEQLQSDENLKQTLETNARQYFDRWLLPEKTVAQIFEKALS